MKKVFRILLLLLTVLSLLGFSCAEMDEDEDWLDEDEEEEEYDDEYWEEVCSDRGKYTREFYGDRCDVEGDTLIILDGVVTLGEYYGEPVEGLDSFYHRTEEERKDDPEIAALFGPDTNGIRTIDLDAVNAFDSDDYTFSGVRWPSSLRILGQSCFILLFCKEIVLPPSVERIYPDAFYHCRFGTVRIESCLPAAEIIKSFDKCWIEAYEVPEDHPLYKTVDGVLYTKDGKQLLAYPSERKEEHFDVPAGVEIIGRSAFSGFAIENKYLKTVSLPIGLKSLEDFAFSGCTRLQAIAVPLTVEHIGTAVFCDCVSLERVSLPEGLEAEKNTAGTIYYQDDGLFRGDNGDTLLQPRKDEDY